MKMNRPLASLLSIILLICVAGTVPIVSAQPREVMVDMMRARYYYTYEDSVSKGDLDCYEAYSWGIRNHLIVPEELDNPVITVDTSLVFVPWPEPDIMGPTTYEWSYDSVPANRWWGVGGLFETTVSVPSGFSVIRTVTPEKVSPPEEQVVVVTLDVDEVPPGANELGVVIGFYPVVWQEDVLLNYELLSWSDPPYPEWGAYQQGPSAIQFYILDPVDPTHFIGEFSFTATFMVTGEASLMGSPVSKPMVEAFWRKLSWLPRYSDNIPPEKHIFEEATAEWSATVSFQVDQEFWCLVTKTELPTLFVDLAPITSPILYDDEGFPHALDEMTFTLASGADLHVYDPAGRHISIDENQIPGATFLWVGDTQIVTVPDPLAGDYVTQLVGTSGTPSEPSEYDLLIVASSGGATLYTETFSDTTFIGEIDECTTSIPSVGDGFTFFLGLKNEVEDLALPKGIEASLVGMLDAASNAFDKGNYKASIRILNSFINHVLDQSDEKIDPEDAEVLIAKAELSIEYVSILP